MRKLTMVGTAFTLSFIVSLLLFSTDAFAQSASPSNADGGANYYRPHYGSHQGWNGNENGNGGWNGNGGCRNSFCNENGGNVNCVNVVKTFRALQERREVQAIRTLQVRREVQAFRALRVYQRLVSVSNGRHVFRVLRTFRVWQVQHVVKTFRTWQVQHVVRLVKFLQTSQRVVRVCHAF